MKKVGCGVVGLDGSASIAVDGEGDFVADRWEVAFDLVGDSTSDFLGAGDLRSGVMTGTDHATIAFLSAHFGEEDGLVGDDEVVVDLQDGGFAAV